MTAEAELPILACDESGNSGPNYLDLAQPIYAHAGWLLGPENLQKLDVQFGNPGEELKGANLVKSAKGCKRLLETLRMAFNCGGIPFVVLFEKRFAIACHMIEIYLDPEYNSRLSHKWIWTGEGEFKSKLANRLATKLRNQTLVSFAQAHRALDAAGLLNVLKLAYDELDALDEKDQMLATLMLGSRNHLNNQIESLKEAQQLMGKGSDTINFLNFVTLLNLVGSGASEKGYSKVSIVHDETKAMTLSFGWAARMLQGLFEMEFDYSEAMSHKVPGIQCADLLAACWRKLATDLIENNPLDESLLQAVRLLFPIGFGGTSVKTERFLIVASDLVWKRMAGKMFRTG